MSRRPRQLLYASIVALIGVAAVPATAMAISVAPPVVSMTFSSSTAAVGDTITLTFTVTNADPVVNLTGIAFVDTLPGGLQTAYPSGLTGSCGGGSIVVGSNSVSLSGAALASGASCTFSVDVLGGPGTYVNTTGNVTSNESNAGNTATASITIGYRPNIAISFSPSQVLPGGISTLTFTLYNPEFASDIDGVSFTDTLPAGLSVADSTTDACDLDPGHMGTLTASGNTISLAGGYLPASWICTFSFTVTSTVAGTFTNSTSELTSANGIPGLAATAVLNVGVPATDPPATDPPATDPPATLPPTSTAPGTPGRSDPSGAVLGLLALVAGLAAAGAARIRHSTRGN
jgi:trimeric autotransporter adhesin